MQLTEEEAKKNWCPFARVSASNSPVNGNHSANRDADDNGPSNGSNCIASECMAWRWGESEYEHPGQGEKVVKNGEHNFIVPISYPEDYIEHKRGYCGLAGRPEGD